ncbi:MAG: hypothetical protein E7022_06145 [Desulfovibrio desulfuricans]|nr:hypothetical protein [Desulfovibrio desulfuricans]
MKALPFDAVLAMGPTYADCLRAMNTAVRQGMEFEVPPEFAPLVGLDPVALEALINMERAFTSQAVSMDMKKSMRKGARMGRPPKELPPVFYEAAERWASGELSCRSAAESCGMPLTTFRSRALSLLGQEGKPRTTGRVAATPPAPGATDTAGACGMATLPRKDQRGRNQEVFLDSLPDRVRKAVLAWMGGAMSLRRAAAAAQMSAKRFKALLDGAGFRKGHSRFSSVRKLTSA